MTNAVAYGRVFITGGVNDPATGGTEGNYAAIKNMVNFQSTVLDPNVLEITFSTANDGTYLNAAAADPNTAKFVKCNYPLAGLPIFFMRVLNPLLDTQTVSAFAVASRDAPTAACIPVGVCNSPGGTSSNNFGYTVGEWIKVYDGTSYGQGFFGWIDFTPPNGGAPELKAILAGGKQCDIAKIGDQVGQAGNIDTLQEAWNSRFGWYKKGGGYLPAEAPPDKAGFAYSDLTAAGAPNAGNWPSGFNAYSGTSSVPNQPNFIDARAVNKPYQETIPEGIKTNQYDPPLNATQLSALGRVDRRVATAPVVNCTAGLTTPILGLGLCAHA